MTKGVLEMKGNKTNKTMRVAGGLLIATLLSTSIVSGTFAKYVTTGSASDSARVAKFGVVVTAEGTLFSKTYLNAEGGNTPGGDAAATSLTVSSSDNVVAPGTKNNTGLKFSITGTPEVDVKVTITASGANDIWLGAGTYADMTSSNTTDTFTVSEAYYPIKYTLKKEGTTTAVATGSLSDINTALTNLTSTYKAGTNLADATNNGFGTYVLTWEWAFESEGNSGIDDVDRKDTLLGDLIAGIEIAPSANKPTSTTGTTASANSYNANVEATFSITVTQVD
jgi:hypothetical protein